MRKWEDIVKDIMEEPDGALPESVFAEFRARRTSGGAVTRKKTHPLVWAIATAVAAGFAAVIILRKPVASEEGIQVIPLPSAPVAMVEDTSDVDEVTPSIPIVAQVAMRRTHFADVKPQEVVTVDKNEPEEVVVIASQEEETVTPETKESVTPVPVMPSSSLFVPEKTVTKPVPLTVGSAVGVVASGGFLAALLVSTLGTKPYDLGVDTGSATGGGLASTSLWDNSIFDGGLVGSPVHHFPLKVGLSAWIPVADRLYISTGLDYSWYRSTFTYSISGEQQQHVHYLGVPVRLDWVFASGKRLDAYVGGGLEGDFCLAASLGGKAISKDRIQLSLVGAGGVQMNVTQRLGIYVEPQLMWRIPTDDAMLATYRSAHPLMFAVSSGLRIGF